jgi:zinc transport system substrate-binding protein
MRRAGLVPALAAAAALAGLLTGCGAPSSADEPSAAPGQLRVVASFYPIAFAVEQVGGERVSVTSLTKAGTEPHDVELTAKDVGRVVSADLVVYAQGFQPAVDTAVEQEGGSHALDVAPVAHLDLLAPDEEDGPEGHHDHAADHAAAAKDPHFWLDPERYADVATAVAERLGAVDPAHAAQYTANAVAVTTRLAELDGDFRRGLASCANPDLVTSHAAFGYLSQRYHLTQVPIAGISPEVEPSAAQLAEVADFVQEHHLTTIYAETLGEPEFADTISRSTGARLATLDPLEGLTSESAGNDYFEVMRANLAVLRAGQGCT